MCERGRTSVRGSVRKLFCAGEERLPCVAAPVLDAVVLQREERRAHPFAPEPERRHVPPVHGEHRKREGHALALHAGEDAPPFEDGRRGGEVVFAGGKVRLSEREQLFEEGVCPHDLPPHLFFAHLQVEVAHVERHKLLCAGGELCGRFEAAEDLLRDARALLGMGVKVAVAEEAERLARVVQERRPADRRRRVAHAAEGVLQNVVIVEVRSLRHAVAARELGHDVGEYARFAQDAQPAVRPVRAARLFVGVQQQVDLAEDAFRHDVADERRVLACARKTCPVGRKSRLRGDARQPQKAQSVLAEYLFRRGDGAQHAGADIGDPAQGIGIFVRGDVVVDGVGAKIAAARIAGDVVGKADLRRRVYAAHIFIGAETGVFVADAVRILGFYRTRGGIYRAHGESAGARGGAEFLVRRGGGEIPVGVFEGVSRKMVAHRASYDIQRNMTHACQFDQIFRKKFFQKGTSLKFF